MCVIAVCGVQCLVAGCRRSGAGQQAIRPGRVMFLQHPSSWTHSRLLATDPRQPTTKHCTPQAAITHIYS